MSVILVITSSSFSPVYVPELAEVVCCDRSWFSLSLSLSQHSVYILVLNPSVVVTGGVRDTDVPTMSGAFRMERLISL